MYDFSFNQSNDQTNTNFTVLPMKCTTRRVGLKVVLQSHVWDKRINIVVVCVPVLNDCFLKKLLVWCFVC